MQFDRSKLKAVILRACRGCESSQLGAVKLHKILYFSDMLHYAQTGRPITGAIYRKRPFGPTCDQLLETLATLAREGAIEIREVEYFGYWKKEYIPRDATEKGVLSEGEIALIDEVTDFVCKQNTAKTISEFSHNRAWEFADFGSILKYNSVFHLFPTQVSPDTLEWAANEVAKRDADKSQKATVARIPFGTLRKKVLEGVRDK
jgi:hypothetical protein